jgi:hypothetical protein
MLLADGRSSSSTHGVFRSSSDNSTSLLHFQAVVATGAFFLELVASGASGLVPLIRLVSHTDRRMGCWLPERELLMDLESSLPSNESVMMVLKLDTPTGGSERTELVHVELSMEVSRPEG